MWSALRSDLKEFASSIASEGNEIRQNIESKIVIEQDGDDAIDEETDMIIGENGEVAYVPSNEENNGDGGDPYIDEEAMEEVLRRADDKDTYLIPLLSREPKPSSASVDVKNTKEDDQQEDSKQVSQGVPTESSNDKAISMDVSDDAFGDSGWSQDDDVSLDEEDQDLNQNAEQDQPSSIDNDLNEDEVEEDPSVIAFLESFDMDSKSKEIGELLADNPDTIGKHFDCLVPDYVTYEQFWQRYFFRCDPERIKEEWQEEDERVRLQRQELINKGKQTVQNLFGGAFKAIKGAASSDSADIDVGNSIYEKYQAELEEKRKALQEVQGSTHSKAGSESEKAGGLGGLLGRVRPPFVMNTAVDEGSLSPDVSNEDDDSDVSEEDDDFGWGSDEDDESDEEGSNLSERENDEESEGTEEVVFTSTKLDNDQSSEIEKLRLELSNVLKVKEELESTVKMQEEKLSSIESKGDATAAVDDDVEKLKVDIFEKNSEVAALKASLEDTKRDEAEILSENNSLKAQLEEKENEIQTLKSSVETVSKQNTEIESLQAEIKAQNQRYKNLQENIEKASALQEEEDAQDNVMLAESLETITSLQAELEQVKLTHAEEMQSLQEKHASELKTLKEIEGEEYKSANDNILKLEEELNMLYMEVERLQNERTEIASTTESEIRNFEETISELKSNLERAEAKLAATAEKEDDTLILQELEETKETVKHLKAECSQLQESILSHEQELAKSKEVISKLESELQLSREELVSTKSFHDSQQIELKNSTDETIKSLERNLKSAEDRISELLAEQSSQPVVDNEELSALKIEIDSLKTQNGQLSTDLKNQSELINQFEELKGTLAEYEQKISSFDEQAESLDAEKKKASLLEAELEFAKNDYEEKSNQMNNEIAKMKEQLQSLGKEKDTAYNEISELKKLNVDLKEKARSMDVKDNKSSPPSPTEGGSMSSGVQVQSPVKEIDDNGDDDDDDGWGDDWSDDEDDL
jgi:DNA repair exonuclease SbcCD ATPase subunit